MRGLIIGGGEAGLAIAQLMSQAGYDTTIIELNQSRCDYLKEKVDGLIIRGSGLSSKVLEEAKVGKSDILVAVSDSDQNNVLACLLAGEYSIKKKVARIKSLEFSRTVNKIGLNKLGIDHIIKPRNLVVNEICNMIEYLNATDAAEFSDGQVSFVSYHVYADSGCKGKSIKDLRDATKQEGEILPLTIVAITRDDHIFIPSEDEIIQDEDFISIICDKGSLKLSRQLLGLKREESKTIFILGAGTIGFELAKRLSSVRYNLKIVDNDPTRCEWVSARLADNALVLCSESTDLDGLKDEGVDNADVFIAVTDDDQANILGPLLAKKSGVKRTIALVNNSQLISLATSLGLDACICPRMVTVSSVLKYIHGGNVLSASVLDQKDAEVIEFELTEKSSVLDKSLQALDIPKGIKVGAIVRHKKVIIPKTDEVLQVKDRVVTFCLAKEGPKARKIFS